MKECKLIRYSASGNVQFFSESGVNYLAFPDYEIIINKYLNQGFNVKSITCDDGVTIYTYLEREI